MTVFNDQWISVSQTGKKSQSFVRLQDINRVIIRETPTSNACDIIAVANGTEFLYAGTNSKADAETAAIQLLRLIETAFGRLSSTQKAPETKTA